MRKYLRLPIPLRFSGEPFYLLFKGIPFWFHFFFQGESIPRHCYSLNNKEETLIENPRKTKETTAPLFKIIKSKGVNIHQPLSNTGKQRGTMRHLSIGNFRKQRYNPHHSKALKCKGENVPRHRKMIEEQRGTTLHSTKLQKLLPAILLYIG